MSSFEILRRQAEERSKSSAQTCEKVSRKLTLIKPVFNRQLDEGGRDSWLLERRSVPRCMSVVTEGAGTRGEEVLGARMCMRPL